MSDDPPTTGVGRLSPSEQLARVTEAINMTVPTAEGFFGPLAAAFTNPRFRWLREGSTTGPMRPDEERDA